MRNLNESTIRRIVNECVKRVLREAVNYDEYGMVDDGNEPEYNSSYGARRHSREFLEELVSNGEATDISDFNPQLVNNEKLKIIGESKRGDAMLYKGERTGRLYIAFGKDAVNDVNSYIANGSNYYRRTKY